MRVPTVYLSEAEFEVVKAKGYVIAKTTEGQEVRIARATKIEQLKLPREAGME